MKARGIGAGILVAACGWGVPASAQYALDRNLQVGSGGINPSRPDFAAEVRLRNAIVTGNAPGGISFRGDVGYRAPGEFLARLGSNDDFAFRRDSFYSGLAGQGIRGTDALQYQFALTTGRAPPAALSGFTGIYTRSGVGATAAQVRQEPALPQPDGTTFAAPRSLSASDDSGGIGLLGVRSPSAFVANRSLQPTVLAVTQDRTGQIFGLSASPLRGIALDRLPLGQTEPAGDGIERPERPGEQRTTPPGGIPPGAAAEPLTPDAATGRAGNRLESGVLSTPGPYEDLIARLRTGARTETGAGIGRPGAEAADEEPAWRRRLEELRRELSDRQGAMATPQPTQPGDPIDPLNPRRPRTEPGQPGATGDMGATGATSPGTASDRRSPRDRRRDGEDEERFDPERLRVQGAFTPETLALLRSGVAEIKTLARPSFDAYGTNMQVGQEHLAAGRFFDAEERFVAALSAKPGDPMASVGRIHAELGAAMFLSAAINLRSLLVEHPELIGAKYAPELLPAPDRIERVLERLGELAGDTDGRGRDPALLLAYLGYQSGKRDAVQRGLDLMSVPPPGGADQLTKLATLLREVWLAPAGEPGPAEGDK